MSWRIHFTTDDLARTRIAAAPQPLVELNVAVRMLQDSRHHPVRFGEWRRTALSRLPAQARLVFDLLPVQEWGLDLLTPAGAGDLRALLEQVRSTPARRLRLELAQLAALREHRRPLPRWTERIGTNPRLLQQVADLLEEVYQHTVEPHVPTLHASTMADRSVRTRHIAEGGMDRMLSGLIPGRVRWEPPVLVVTKPGGAQVDIDLGGRGLLLVPSLFGSDYPILALDAEPQPLMTYPVHDTNPGRPLPAPVSTSPTPATPYALASLLGRTRATVLTVIAEYAGCTTAELAALASIAPASASEHASVLRKAGLVTTVRHHKAALHSPTQAGILLLDSPKAALAS
ncbi:winged helix-turn-helix domain-containing protein [Amycolatopsis cihanbeyliensis]|uniref:Helix-turn-helix protein n=1 Tax=Amycolatopsis cihanbeyliensis TaxID=1128664 RepID=A0A542DER6_AMYCI|nr:helix-turn-helix domain-containing protein [Amycolatopsis cihanbeyliensis]TQJ01544.1 helix-turn-helix protein [Amycolatopsis cihanbeyliensis]